MPKQTKEQASVSRKKDKAAKQNFIQDYKSAQGCAHCGYNEHPVALDLDHIDPKTKIRTPLKWTDLSWKQIEDELAKCQVLCANCHRIKTYLDKEYSK